MTSTRELQQSAVDCERARIKAGQLKELESVVLFDPVEGSWSVEYTSKLATLPKFLQFDKRLLDAERAAKIYLRIKGKVSRPTCIFARAEKGKILCNATSNVVRNLLKFLKNNFFTGINHRDIWEQMGAGPLAMYRYLVDLDSHTIMDAYWEVVHSFHDAIFDGYCIPEKGKKYKLTPEARANLPENVTATEVASDADLCEEDLTPFSNVTFELDPQGTVFMSLHTVETLLLNEKYPAITVAHAKKIGAHMGSLPMSCQAWRAYKDHKTPTPTKTSLFEEMQDEVVDDSQEHDEAADMSPADENNNEVVEIVLLLKNLPFKSTVFLRIL